LRIAIDARELRGKPTGVGRYLAETLAAWKTLPEIAAHDVVLCAPDEGSAGTRWEQLTLPGLIRRAGADVFFAPGYTGPLRCPVPMVVAVHDVSFWAHPEWFSPREGIRRRVLTKWSARRAARVLTISEFSKTEIVKHLGVAKQKVEVIYPGVGSLADRKGPPRSSQESDAARASVARDNMVLYVGSVFNRRHVPELIEGFARLAGRHAGARLEIVGDNRTTPRIDLDAAARASGATDRIRLRNYVSDEDLSALYGQARAMAFLSDYEGFGFTPLEALAAGVPIVVLDTPVAREICRDAAMYVGRPDPVVIEAALERALFDDAERARVLAAAAGVLRRYSWATSARRTLQTLVTCGG
jgi:glycosyltransferase involved in cell wall biosynthesis